MGATWVAKLLLGRQLPCGVVGLMLDLCDQEINVQNANGNKAWDYVMGP